MSNTLEYYFIYSDERYGLHRKLNRVEKAIPEGSTIYDVDQPEVEYVEDQVPYVMPEQYKAVDIDGERWRVAPDGVTAYKLVPEIDPVTNLDARSKLCCYDIPSGEWRRYVHTVQHYTEEEFRAMVTRPGQADDYDFPPCWTPEEWNSLSEECRLILERPVQDAAWCHCSDSRDQDNIGDNPVV